MRKKYLSALLFGALLVTSAGTFTSCKDYDDDINNLQEQIDKLATKEDMEAKLSQMQAAIDAAKKTAEDALAKAEAAGDSEEINDLKERVAALEEAMAKVETLKAEIKDMVDEQLGEFRIEMQDFMKEVEELTGYSLGMVTEISFVAKEGDLTTNVEKYNPNLNVNYARINISYPKDLVVGGDPQTPDSYEFGKGLTGAFTVTNNEVNTVADKMLVNLNPVDAVVTNEMISLVNAKGQNLNEYLDMTINSWSGQIVKSRNAESTGLRMVSVQLKKTVDFETFDKMVLPDGAHKNNPSDCDGEHSYIAYALAVTDADKSRTVTSSYDVTLHVKEEPKAENIAGLTYVYSNEASIPAEPIGEYVNGTDATSGDEGCYPVQLGTAFDVYVDSNKGRVMASYIVVDYDNAKLSTTDKAALKGIKFSGVDQVTKNLYHSISISGDYATGVPVPLKLVTIDYTGNVEVNVFWVKVGEPVLMDANFTVTPTTYVANPNSWAPASTMEEFKVPAETSTFTLLLVAGETAHQEATKYEVLEKTQLANISNYLTLFKSDKTTTTYTAKDVAYAKFAGELNLWFMREDKEYEGVVKFYDAKGTYLGSNSISVKKVLPTSIPNGLTAKTNAIHSDGTLPVYPKPGTTVGQYDLTNSFNFSDALKSDVHLTFNTPTFEVNDDVYAEYSERTIVNIVKDVIGSSNTYPTTVTYNYGDIKYHPEGHGVQEPEAHVVTWGTQFNIKFGCYPVDSEYSWYTAPEVYYQTNTTILGVDMKDGAVSGYKNFMVVKNPYGHVVDAFDNDDKDWTTWADAFNQGINKEVYLLTNGDRKNEFFTPSFVVEKGVTGLKLECDPSVTTVLEADVETTVVLVVNDRFGHKHEIKALTFTMKKDAK